MGIVVTPFVFALQVVLYRDLKARKEHGRGVVLEGGRAPDGGPSLMSLALLVKEECRFAVESYLFVQDFLANDVPKARILVFNRHF